MSKNIDPPYNTGARDWKYNNDYVDSSDAYRHSKWLSMMEKRLRLAKKLLNPEDSVLICTIDEKEYLHLGCLLEELFPEADGNKEQNYAGRVKTQMVTSVINPSGVAMKKIFSRAEEYIFYIFIGNASVCSNENDMLHFREEKKSLRWASLLRSGNNSSRSARPNLFYPLFFDKITGKLVSIGESPELNEDISSVTTPDQCFVVWPKKNNGTDGTWQLSQKTLIEKIKAGYFKYGPWKQGDRYRTISYFSTGMEKLLKEGKIEDKGRDENGSIIVGKVDKKVIPLTVWNQSSHSAGDNGSSLLLSFFHNKRFTFPKSLYAVKDTIRLVMENKPNALILDFFAGSGTTLHAVNLLNADDGGQRRCILVTNNEVSDAEAKKLIKEGHKPGDQEWERLGIARYVTWPRTVCSIEGNDVNGRPLKGNYLDSDREMSHGFEANVIYFKLGFLDKTAVALGRQFRELLSVLWMKAGATGVCPKLESEVIPKMLILPDNCFAVLTDEGVFPEFLKQLEKTPEIETVFIVTDSEPGYREMASNLQVETTYQLYRDYLDNFRINTERK